jgi:hypothetical protein
MSAAGGAGAFAVGPKSSIRATADLPLPLLRTSTLYNANQKSIHDFDINKLSYITPVRPDGKPGFYKDGMDGICVPLAYNGMFAMNFGWIVRHGRFETAESTLKGDKTVQLVAHYPVHAVDEALTTEMAADERKADMYALLKAIHGVETLAKAWIAADKEGRMFGVTYSESDLEPKTRLDGKLEKGKFSTQIYAGTTKAGDPAYLKTYFKMPHTTIDDDPAIKLYCDLTVNGRKVEPILSNFLEHVCWRNDVGIVFSFRDMYKSSYGISVRFRIDIVGAWEAPKPAFVALSNPFLAGSEMLEDD